MRQPCFSGEGSEATWIFAFANRLRMSTSSEDYRHGLVVNFVGRVSQVSTGKHSKGTIGQDHKDNWDAKIDRKVEERRVRSPVD